MNGFIDLMKMALPNATLEARSSAVDNAAVKSHVEVVYVLIAAGALIGVREGGLALIDAVRAGHLQLAGRLLCREIDVNMEDKRKGAPAGGTLSGDTVKKETAINIAAVKGFILVVQALIWKGVQIGYAEGGQALIKAIVAGHMPLVKRLLNDHDIDVNAETGRPLTMAAVLGHEWLVEALLEKGADVHVRDDKPLKYAVEKGHTAIVKVLLGSAVFDEAPIDAALAIAVREKHFEVRELLVEAKEEFKEVWNGVDKLGKGKFVVG
ncbi:hypothetical protein HDV00_009768 [Rhizophlyctis rosea]|nr:hypothetical protein HDV00_009768 [Rhizophlyctis rosea]